MRIIDLNGVWTLTRAGKEPIDGRVPGTVHQDLMRAQEISDPFWRDEEERLRWIGETEWTYSRKFHVGAETLSDNIIELQCDGLDTLAEIRVNNRQVGKTDNMFRLWQFDVKGLLHEGENTIEMRFDSPLPLMRAKQAERPLPAWDGAKEEPGRGHIRKSPCNFGWDWGPVCVTAGIWRPIAIKSWREGRLGAIRIRQGFDDPNNGVILYFDVGATCPCSGTADCMISITLHDHDGNEIGEVDSSICGDVTTLHLPLRVPDMWWPAGMGDQPLYRAEIHLIDASGDVVDTATHRIGVRRMALRRQADAYGESFEFVVNDKPFFAKGANWIPADVFSPRATEADRRRLVEAAAAANMNMLRVWGGGVYETDEFYDACDELGICVWQDFMFACSTYPTYDDEFLESVSAEATDQVLRLRNHPCIALWCGNNELEQGLVGDEWGDSRMSWKDYGKLFDTILPDIVEELDPERDYWPCSPHTPIEGDRANHSNPTAGDAHLWDVWHGRQPFEWYRGAEHRFCSEFGFQSFPEPRTVARYTEPSDRNIASYIMEQHQRSPIGNTTIVHYMMSRFKLPADFDSLLWLSQILQGLAIQYAVEHFRRNRPRCMGALYWQLNDCWPVASWSSLDYFGKWKALHYFARRFYAPVLLSAVEDPKRGTLELFVNNDQLEPLSGAIRWEATDLTGKRLACGEVPAKVAPNSAASIETVNLAGPLGEVGPRDLIVWLRLETEAGEVSENMALFAPPKHLELPDPKLSATLVEETLNGARIRVRAERPALWVWLDGDFDGKFTDNFFHLGAGEQREIEIQTARAIGARAIMQSLRVNSVWHTHTHP